MNKSIIQSALVAAALLFITTAHAAGTAINETGETPEASAMLDVRSVTKGLLPPRMTAAERGGIATPATGLMVYQTDGTTGLYLYNGTAWKQVLSGTVIQATGTAATTEVLSGSTFSTATAAGLTGTMTNNGAVTITPAATAQPIAAGYHNGSGTVATDANLIAANIKSGTAIFGVTGTISPASVAKTGQVIGYDGLMPPRDDGTLQIGVAWPNPRFTVNAGTVRDNLTGLIWLQNANCANVTRAWSTAFSELNVLNSGGTMNAKNCGDTSNGGTHQTDWRMPNIKELQSLVAFAYSSPPLSNTNGDAQWTTGAPFTNVLSLIYWSSSTSSGNSNAAWYVNMANGLTNNATKTTPYYVWPVRGGQ